MTEPKLKDVWIKVSHPLQKTREWGPLRDQLRRYQQERIVEECRLVVQTQLTSILTSKPKDLDTRLSPMTMPKTCSPSIRGKKIIVIGLPSTAKTRLAMRKEELRDDRLRRKNGELTRAEEEVRKKIEEKERKSREEAEGRELQDENNRRAARESNKENFARRERSEGIEGKEVVQGKLRRKIRRAEELRKKERKRVPIS
jgi:hypothetical protein